MNKEEALKLLREDIDHRHYSEKTKDNYVTYLEQLLSYYEKRDPSTITLDEINDFVSSLEKIKGRSPQTISLAVNSLAFFYNKVLKLNYDFKRVSYKKRRFVELPNILEPDEILRLLDSIDNLKNRAMITMLYSSGLTINQTISIKIKDIDFANRRFRVTPYNNRKKHFYSILSESATVLLQKYREKFKPEKYLFEGRTPGQPYYSGRQIDYAFKDAKRRAGITRDTSIMDLRHSYIIHLRDFGYPVSQVLELMGTSNSSTLKRYSIANLKYDKELKSPLDLILDRVDRKKVDTRMLRNLSAKIEDEDEQNYCDEAIDCFGCGALRAGVVLVWIAVMRNIQMKCLRNVDALNESIVRHYPKAKHVDMIEDFAYIKDDVTLKAAHDCL